MTIGTDTELLAVFLSAFAAATLLPGGSEAVLLAADHAGSGSDIALVVVATLGNTLGGMTSWLIGRVIPPGRFDTKRLERSLERVRRHGAAILLLSWVPLIGDPLCVAAGWLRIGWLPAMVFMALGKGARYVVLVWLV